MAQPTPLPISVPAEDPKKKKEQKEQENGKTKVNGDAAEGEELVSKLRVSPSLCILT